jgi:uncharacterized protein
MRDLASRLREIVRQPVTGPRRELTYVSEIEAPRADPAGLASILGGVLREASGGSCVVIDRTWEPEAWHGRRRIDAYVIESAAPLALFAPRLAAVGDSLSRTVFFDIETTGLSGGAGTLPLLAGCGWFEDGRFVVRQFFLAGPAGERALLEGLTEVFETAALLVTYNGRTFDVPVMETRWAFHRRSDPLLELPHLDMLPIARRLWGQGALASCTLSALERAVLRFHRVGDVPGLEIPSRYFQFLRTGDVSVIAGVLEHNRHDILSLAAVTGHAFRLAAEGPDVCEEAGEQLGLGHLYERAGNIERAEHAYALASVSEDEAVAADALGRLAVLLRRQARYQEAAAAWMGVLSLSQDRSPDGSLERRAVEALAIHHEHRVRDLDAARRYAEALGRGASGRRATEAQRRLDRLQRKMRKSIAAGDLLG